MLTMQRIYIVLIQRRSDSHVHYALMNIPRTKNHQYNNRKSCAAKIMMGFGGGVSDAESVSSVRSNIACLCDLQMVAVES